MDSNRNLIVEALNFATLLVTFSFILYFSGFVYEIAYLGFTGLDADVEYPPTHVTLYTLEGGAGIFMVDSDDMKQYSKLIPNPAQ